MNTRSDRVGMSLMLAGIMLTAIATTALASSTDPQRRCHHGQCNMLYFGGKVERTPTVYMIFWGSKWTASPSDNLLAHELINAVSAYSGSGWEKIFTQYYQKTRQNGTQYITDQVKVGGIWFDPATPKNDAVAPEAMAAAKQNKWPSSAQNPNVQYMVFPQQGTTQSVVACGWHHFSNNENFVVDDIYYASDQPCGGDPSELAKDMEATVAHEFAEAVTDPWWDAWNAGAVSNEIADQCLSLPPAQLNTNSGPWIIALWNNRVVGCVYSL